LRRDIEDENAFMLRLAMQLAKEHEVKVLCPYGVGLEQYEEFCSDIKVFRYRYMPFKLERIAYGSGIVSNIKKNRIYFLQVPFFILFQLVALRRIIRQFRIPLIHAHWIIPQGIVAVLYKKLFNRKIRILATIHGGDIWGFDGAIGTWLKKFVLNNIDALTVVSDAVKNEVEKLGYTKNVDVISMGVDTRRFSPEFRDESMRGRFNISGPFLLFVGVLNEVKGVEYLLRALPRVLRVFQDTKVLVIGDGTLKESLIKLTDELGISSNVIFLGRMPHAELPPYFASADIFVGPSLSEGFGLVFAEAMSSGSIVIASDLRAIRDIIDNNKTGFTVPPRDSELIAEKIIDVLSHIDSFGKMRVEARQHIVKSFDWEIVGMKYLKVAEVLSK
jgi:glycosyltransferase involved in cell wall biosynthesis